MNVRNLFTDHDAVSPVIGVILMVAITVILAAVIGAFVLNIGGSQDAAPQASFDFENTSSGIGITMQSGEALDGDNIEIQVDGETNVLLSDDGTDEPGIDEMTSGDSVCVDDDGNWATSESDVSNSFSSGTEVSIVWQSPSSGDTSIIGSYETS